MKNVRNIVYLIRHKLYVIIAGIKLKTPVFRLLAHDLSKLLPSEFSAYANHFYGNNDNRKFNIAWLKHVHRNDHHWQYWLLREDDGDTIAMDMPLSAIKEMVADWYSAGYVITGRKDLREWYNKNKDNITLHPRTRVIVETYIDYLCEV